MKLNESISVEKLKEHLQYNSETGVFIWVNPTANRLKEGEEAGTPHENGYIKIRLFGKGYFAHRLAWLYVYGEWPQGEIDHINRKKNDNSIANLRLVTHTQNQMNIGLRSNNTTGIKGVIYDESKRLWRARITVEGRQVHLGYFTCKYGASRAREMAEKRYGFIGIDP